MSFLRQKNEATGRISFLKVTPALELPNLIELQRESYERFVNEGLRETFSDFSPIKDFGGNLELSFGKCTLREPVHSVDECRGCDDTFARPLHVDTSFSHLDEAGRPVKIDTDIFMGEFPAMTDTGTFVVNGAERVIVSQLVRSPGIYYQHSLDTATGRSTWTATVIPNRGAWLELETDTSDVIYARIDKARKLPASVLLRALGYGTREEVAELFNNDPLIEKTLEKDGIDEMAGEEEKKPVEIALTEIYKKQRPGEITTPEGAQQLLNNLFFESKRYDLAKVGSFRLARKLGRKVVCPQCGQLQHPGSFVCSDPECGARLSYSLTLSVKDIVAAVRYMLALMKAKRFERYNDEQELNEGLPLYIKDRTIYLKALDPDCFDVPVFSDDIDHLGNRRIRCVGELLQNQFRVGLQRLERVIKERMSTTDVQASSVSSLINIRPVTAAIKEFFGSSQLSQFMDQTNMLAELTHKRRLSALGPGGLSRERAGFEVRDVHYSHYGRICPIETPEGPNIGLIGSLATYGKVNEFGFIETPYRKVNMVLDQDVIDTDGKLLYHKGDVVPRFELQELESKLGHLEVKVQVTDHVDYMSADREDEFVIAQANTNLDERNFIIDDRVVVREKNEPLIVSPRDIDYMDVTSKQMVSVATALIPFLEHDDANRALMGANMQRQAVPLINPQAPIVGTGMEYRAAKDSGALMVSKHAGVITAVSATSIVICDDKGEEHEYRLHKFRRSNSGTCINQRPIVKKGQRVKVNDILADGTSSVNGELALGRNVLVAFMPWEGFNYEDAILLSEEVVRDDVFTSIHIEEYDCEARDTKLGAEEITRDIPNVGEDMLRNLDENGIIRIGAEVRTEDILVGKVTPKGETELTAEERLLRAIFGEKSRDVRDTSLKVPHGERGKVIDIKVFDRNTTDSLKPGVNRMVRVYVAQKRKILQGDKMAGRHGNKGVVSRIMPVEDMPFLPDGTPVQIVLNPLGVPSRMNIGQILETHLGMAMRMLSGPEEPVMRVEVPVFDSVSEDQIHDLMGLAKLQSSLKQKGIYLSTPELVDVLDEQPLYVRLLTFINDHDGVVLTTKEVKELIESAPANLLAGKVIEILQENGVKHVDTEALAEVIAEHTLEEKLSRVLSTHVRHYSAEQVKELAQYIIDFKSHVVTDGKTILYDGRTGEPYDTKVMVGQIYMLKLLHLVDDKIHARSTGPYSLITQQPLGGKAQFGGQRFGEMEVWALEAYGAAYTLQELLTVKSDDVVGRVKTYEAIVKGENVMDPGVPESFKVLMKELQSLALDVRVLDKNGKSKEMRSVEDQDIVNPQSRDTFGYSEDTNLR